MKTKWIALAIFSGIIIFGSSCKKIKDLLTFDLPYTSSEFTIPMISQTAVDNADTTITITTPSIPTNSESTFKSKNTASKLIKEITLSSFNLQITSPSNGTYDFLKLVEVYISTSGQPEVLIASKSDVPSGTGATLNLDVTGTNLMNYIKADNFALKIKFKVDQATAEDYKSKANMVFQVKADPL
jgi:hypothetical protein